MVKTNLPVILLKGLILLPHNEIRIELERDEEKKILENSSIYHDDHILLVSIEKDLKNDVNNLPKTGVIGKVKSKIELNDGRLRLVIAGINRANIYSYLNFNNDIEILEGIIGAVPHYDVDPNEELALRRKLFKELETYINNVPFMSNSIISQITGINNVNEISDIVASNLILTLERKQKYLRTINPTTRMMMLLEDINAELESIEIEKQIDQQLKKELDNTQREFILREKINIIKKELGEVNTKEEDVNFLKEQLLVLKAPKKIKNRIETEIKKYELMNINSPEMGVIRNYIDWMFSLPWYEKTTDIKDLKKIRKSLDNSHYSLDKVKERIVEYIAVKQISNNLTSPIICLVGPPGTGKTTLAKSIAESLGRNFVKISVGGVNDEAEITGHRRTYIGSAPGRIIQAMKKSKSTNPVFLIDEIDKMTRDIKGDPASSLLDILDKEQNKHFSDNYIEEEYDLSNVMFILTANYFYQIPEALRDRLEVIELSSYTEYEKLDIVKKYIFPKEIFNHNLKRYDITIKEEAILEIIRYYTKEAGVRELERLIATICRKIVLEVLENEKLLIIINKDKIAKYLGCRRYHYSTIIKNAVGTINGLAYTEFGGDVIPIEVNLFAGKGDLQLTGSLGEVMKESARIALSYIKANSEIFSIKKESFLKYDIHIHLPEGAVPKDGPSAGITLTTALISAFSSKSIKDGISMTGEITLRGNVLPIGGIREKVIGAKRNNIKNIILPTLNKKDIEELNQDVKQGIKFQYVSNYLEIYNIIFGEKK